MPKKAKKENRSDVVHVSSRKLIKLGDSVAITIPPEWLEAHDLNPGDTVGTIANGFLKVIPAD